LGTFERSLEIHGLEAGDPVFDGGPVGLGRFATRPQHRSAAGCGHEFEPADPQAVRPPFRVRVRNELFTLGGQNPRPMAVDHFGHAAVSGQGPRQRAKLPSTDENYPRRGLPVYICWGLPLFTPESEDLAFVTPLSRHI
jgi:hypothetical protein